MRIEIITQSMLFLSPAKIRKDCTLKNIFNPRTLLECRFSDSGGANSAKNVLARSNRRMADDARFTIFLRSSLRISIGCGCLPFLCELPQRVGTAIFRCNRKTFSIAILLLPQRLDRRIESCADTDYTNRCQRNKG